jgi:hypothetical protein
VLKILYANFGPHDEGDMIVGGAQGREAAPDSPADLSLVPDDEIRYLQGFKDRQHSFTMGNSVGGFVTDVPTIRDDHKARQSHAHSQAGELIAGHPDPGVFHQHDRLHATQPRAAAEAHTHAFIGDRPGDKIRIFEKTEINLFEPASFKPPITSFTTLSFTGLPFPFVYSGSQILGKRKIDQPIRIRRLGSQPALHGAIDDQLDLVSIDNSGRAQRRQQPPVKLLC